MHLNVLLSSLLLATSAVALPDLLRRNGCFSGPHGIGSCNNYSPNGKADKVAASAASASAQAASSVSVAAVSASAAADLYAIGQSQLSVASAIEAVKSSAQVQEKLAMTSGALESSPTATLVFSTAYNHGFEFAQAARYGHG